MKDLVRSLWRGGAVGGWCSLVLFAGVAVFAASALNGWLMGYSWHEQQRIFQLVLLMLVAPMSLCGAQQSLDYRALLMLAAILLLGACSSLLSAFPAWAFKEWAVFAGLLLLVVMLGAAARPDPVRRGVIWVLVLTGALNAWQFLMYYLMAFVTGIHMLDPLLLFSGFDHARFLGQFQMLLLPMLATLIVQMCDQAKMKLAALLLVVLVVQWGIAWSLDGRGLWAGLLVGHLALLFISPRLRQLVIVQAGAALAGYMLLLVLFKLIPHLCGLEQVLGGGGLRTGLTGRNVLWRWAWDMVVVNPWLGVGPMHYAATYNPIAAHPHQMILQWLAEWGTPATLMVLFLCGWGGLHGALLLRSKAATPEDAGLWLAIGGTLVLAQVDGVFVMPYTETWLAVLIGLALARWSRPVVAGGTQRLVLGALALPTILILGRVLLMEAPHVPQQHDAYLEKHAVGVRPRFWLQGWVPGMDE